MLVVHTKSTGWASCLSTGDTLRVRLTKAEGAAHWTTPSQSSLTALSEGNGSTAAQVPQQRRAKPGEGHAIATPGTLCVVESPSPRPRNGVSVAQGPETHDDAPAQQNTDCCKGQAADRGEIRGAWRRPKGWRWAGKRTFIPRMASTSKRIVSRPPLSRRMGKDRTRP